EYKNRYGVDGIMIGRASIGYPWIFREIRHFVQTGAHHPPPTLQERVAAAKSHLTQSIKWKGEKLGVLEMRRHYTNYFKGLANVKEFRSRLVTELSPEMLYAILDQMEQELHFDVQLAHAG
ncbi:MAG TPA: tRNA-dihydrouridine synthase, partial [Saprospiraceae bacterium]|nr:tRNA-dihydrouridine synthase [Saprospiraceae bacterium]